MKKQLIIKDSQTAMEINPLGSKPVYDYQYPSEYEHDFKESLLNWQQAESSLKEYKIEGIYLEKAYVSLENINEVHLKTLFIVNSIHTFEVNEETLTAIVL